MSSLLRVALTGGPCSGKSTVQRALVDRFQKRGWRVYCIPEVPTLVIEAGARFPQADASKEEVIIPFERSLMELQLQLEKSFCAIANTHAATDSSPTILLMDRGLLDIAAYVDTDTLKKIMAPSGWTLEGFAEQYDLGIHLVTAADGAEEHYETNHVRKETPQQAVKLDRAVYDSWNIHPRRYKIENTGGGMEEKIQRTFDLIVEATKRLKRE